MHDYILFLLVSTAPKFYILQNRLIHIPSLDGQVRLEPNTYWRTVYVVWYALLWELEILMQKKGLGVIFNDQIPVEVHSQPASVT